MTFPRMTQYFERKSGLMLTGYHYPPIDENIGGEILKDAIVSVGKGIKAIFSENSDKIEASEKDVNSGQSGYVLAGSVAPMNYSNANVPRQISRVLSNYQKLKSKTDNNKTIMNFEVPGGISTFDEGTTINFGYFYTGGDLLGKTLETDTITAVSDVFNLTATNSDGVRFETTPNGPIKLTVQIAKEDLTSIGFPEDMPVNLYFMPIDSTRWTDLGLISDSKTLEIRDLGYYIVGTSVKGDHQAPIIFAELDTLNNRILIRIDENLALSPDKVIASYNGVFRKLNFINNNYYELLLNEDEKKKNGYLVVNAIDIAGNRGVLEKSFELGATNNPIIQHNALSLIVYPNPAKETITIELPQDIMVDEVEILDISGKSISKYNIVNKQSINISSYSNGIYFIKSKYGTQKFIKQ